MPGGMSFVICFFEEKQNKRNNENTKATKTLTSFGFLSNLRNWLIGMFSRETTTDKENIKTSLTRPLYSVGTSNM